MDIKELHEAHKQATQEVKSLVERQSEEIKRVGETTDQTANQLKTAEEKLEQVEKDFSGRLEELEKRAGRPEGSAAEAFKSAGQSFVENDEVKTALDRGVRDFRAEVKSILTRNRVETKDITSVSDSAGAVAVSDRVMQIFRDPGRRTTFIRDLMRVEETSMGSIEFYVDHNAGDEMDAGPQDGELSQKNKSDLKLEMKTAPVRTVSHWVAASRQVLEDASMLRGYIDRELTYGLAKEEDRQLLYGDGSGGTLEGIMEAGIQDHGKRPSDEDRIAHIRRAITKARKREYAVDGIVLNPEDWADIELMQSSDGHYIWAWYMATSGETRLWRVPVIETNAIEPGEFLLGNWALGATLWDRMQAEIRVSDSHDDYFVRNGVAILGEERLALTVQKPKAFVKGSFEEESSN